MDEKQFQELVEKIGREAADKIKSQFAELETKQADTIRNLAPSTEVENLKTEIASLKAHYEGILKTQGEALTELKNEAAAAKAQVTAKKSLQQFINEKADELSRIQKQGHGFIEVELKAAGITGVSTSITDMTTPPGSPYMPSPDGGDYPLYNRIYNPNFILNYVDMGRTDRSILPWNNELAAQGGAAAVAEGGSKPLTQFQFQSEVSKAKKIAAWMNVTDEFEQDLPGLATQVQRLLQDNVIRKFDDTIQAAVIAIAPGFTLTSMDDKVDNADNWAAIGAGVAQITTNNYTTNVIALNPVTAWLMHLTKGSDGHYVVPPFLQRFGVTAIIEANKVAAGKVLIGDLKQYKVDIYKDYTLKMGFVNDDFAKNQFSIVGEIRYHDYISNNRKAAIAYYDLATVVAQLETP